MADDVQLTDLEVIQRYSLAVRGASAPRGDLIAALQADLGWLLDGQVEAAPAPKRRAPEPQSAVPIHDPDDLIAETQVAKAPLREEPVTRSPAKRTPAIKTPAQGPAPTPVKTPAKRTPAKAPARRTPAATTPAATTPAKSPSKAPAKTRPARGDQA